MGAYMGLTPNYLYLKIIFMVSFKSTKIIELIDKALMPPVDPYFIYLFIYLFI